MNTPRPLTTPDFIDALTEMKEAALAQDAKRLSKAKRSIEGRGYSVPRRQWGARTITQLIRELHDVGITVRVQEFGQIVIGQVQQEQGDGGSPTD